MPSSSTPAAFHACARALLLAGPGQSLISQEIAREAIDDYIANASFGQAAIETPWVAPRPAAETVAAPAVAAEVRDPPPVTATPPQTAAAEAPVAETAVAEGPVAEAPAESAIIPEPQAPDVDPPPLHTPDTDQAADQPAGALIDIPPPPAVAPQAAETRAARGKSLRPNRLLRSGRLHAQALRSDPASPSPKFAGFRRRRAAQPEQSAAPASSPPAAQQAMRRASALGWSIAAATLAGLVATLYLLQAPDGMTAVIRQSERLGRSLNEASPAMRAHLAALIEWIRRIAETLKI